MSELMKLPERIDAFDVDAADAAQDRRVIQGVRLRFTNDFTWINDDDQEIASDLELVVVDRVRVLQKWINQAPVKEETRFLEATEKWPDVEAMNEAAPRSEWRDGPDGRPQGPWQCQWVIYLLDLITLDKYTYPTNTTGGHILVGDISDRIKTMRRPRGHVYPVVQLGDKYMSTRFGGRQRPHFVIQRWISLDGEGRALPAPEEPHTPAQQLEAFAQEQPAEPTTQLELPTAEKPVDKLPAAKTVKTKTTKRGVTRIKPAITTIEEPTLAEELDDEIGF
jgi:hypothetical protein